MTATTESGAPRVVVVGGGLAGLTAAIRLADGGAAVTLLEARPRLGGATTSFARGSLVVDTGQHAFLRCYERYRALLERLGVTAETSLQDRLTIPVLSPGRAPTAITRSALPAPAHLAAALLRYPLLTVPERLRAVRAAAALRRLDPEDERLDQISFGQWLRAHGQGDRAMAALWALFVVAALNTAPDEASLALAVRVFRTGLLDTAAASDIGMPLVPLGQLHGTAAERALAGRGGVIHLRAKVMAIRPTAAGFDVILPDGEIPADAVVLAVPHAVASTLVPPEAGTAAETWARLGADPIVNVHVRYEQRVTDVPFAAVVDSPVQWVFDRTAVAGADGQYLAVSLSAASDFADTTTEELRQVFLPALAAIFPDARSAPVAEFFVTRERRATFHQAPGTLPYRPRARTALPGLALAGAWTRTGWPDTMEGAVRSGEEAARVVARHLRPGAARATTEVMA